MARLVIEVEVDVDPRTEDPDVVGEYLLDPDSDDPPCTFVSAHWKPLPLLEV